MHVCFYKYKITYTDKYDVKRSFVLDEINLPILKLNSHFTVFSMGETS